MNTKNANKQAIQTWVGTAVLGALVIILQMIAGGIKLGLFTITLSLVPIILGAILFGPLSGGILGGLFGAVVCYAVITGADVDGHIMFEQLPVLTIVLCLLKSIAAGVAAGWIWKLLKDKKPILGVILAAIACPVCNTGILCIGMLAFYYDLITEWAIAAEFQNAFLYVILGIVGANFLVELTINLVLTPAILQVIKAVKKLIH